MTAAHATSAVVDLGDGSLGILTDRDLRTRVVAAGLAGDTPVSVAMSAPAYTCPPDRLGGDVLLDMLDRGFRHFPVVSATGTILGVIEEIDLVAAQTRSSFYLRRRIARAQTVEELIDAARELRPTVIAMHDAHVAAVERRRRVLGRRRRADAAAARAVRCRSPATWASSSRGWRWAARHGARPCRAPTSTARSCGSARRATPTCMRGYTRSDGPWSHELEACGLRADEHGATASDPRFVRSLDSWKRAVRSWIDDPTQEKALRAGVGTRRQPACVGRSHRARRSRTASASRRTTRPCSGCWPGSRCRTARRPGSSAGSSSSPPGEHRGRLDLKQRGVLPIVDLARWAGIAAGVTSASTRERLRAAAAAGTLSDAHARTLDDALTLITDLRVEHQVDQLRAGRGARRLRQPGGAHRPDPELSARGVPRGGVGPEATLG